MWRRHRSGSTAHCSLAESGVAPSAASAAAPRPDANALGGARPHRRRRDQMDDRIAFKDCGYGGWQGGNATHSCPTPAAHPHGRSKWALISCGPGDTTGCKDFRAAKVRLFCQGSSFAACIGVAGRSRPASGRGSQAYATVWTGWRRGARRRRRILRTAQSVWRMRHDGWTVTKQCIR